MCNGSTRRAGRFSICLPIALLTQTSSLSSRIDVNSNPSWRGKENYSEVALQPLDVTTAEQLLSTLTPDVELPPPLKKYVVERADGNPFFLEEIVRSLREDGSLVLNAGRLQMPVGQLRVPQ